MSTLAIAFIDSKAQPDAPAYYRLFRTEPVLPFATIHIGSQKSLSGMTTSILLENIIENVEKNQDILIVSHGTADGLSIPIQKNSQRSSRRTPLMCCKTLKAVSSTQTK